MVHSLVLERGESAEIPGCCPRGGGGGDGWVDCCLIAILVCLLSLIN